MLGLLTQHVDAYPTLIILLGLVWVTLICWVIETWLREHITGRLTHTRGIFLNLINSKFKLISDCIYHFSDWFGSKRTSIWIQINRKMINTIWFRVYLRRFRKDYSVCSWLSIYHKFVVSRKRMLTIENIRDSKISLIEIKHRETD